MTLNLVQHRAEPNIWDEVATMPFWDRERWLVAMIAGALLVAGLRRRSGTGLMLALGGSSLAWWAAGEADERQLRRARMHATLPRRRQRGDLVNEAAEESFPASDPPAWTPTTGSADCSTPRR